MTQGFLVVDKPSGPTSHDVVAAVRRATGIKKVGHAGTLDPMATGAVVVAINCTRLLRFVQDLPKEYVADVRFGITTASLDADGEETGRMEMWFGRQDLERILPEFTGSIMQVPPMVSALKHEGKRLHALARQGVEVEREARPVRIDSIGVESFTPGPFPHARLRVVCGSGTYIRSLADDIGGRLGGGAHLEGLRRIRVGSLAAEHGLGLDRLEGWVEHLITPADALGDLESMTVADPAPVTTGRPLEYSGAGLVRVLDQDGELLAVYRGDGELARPEVVLA